MTVTVAPAAEGRSLTLSWTDADATRRPLTEGAAGTQVVAGLEAFGDLATIEPVWRMLEREAVFPAYQRFDFLALWQRHIGDAAGIAPFIVVGRDGAGRPAFLWPLGRRRVGPLMVAEPLGGKHVNYNFGLWRKDIAEALDATATADLVARIGRLGPRLDIISIERQPESWHDVPNPLRLLPHHATPSFGWRGRLADDPAAYLGRTMSADTRNKFRRKERKLAALPGYRYVAASSPGEAERLLGAHFAQKAARMRAAGLANVFAEPGVEAFLRNAARHGVETGRPLLECHALVCDDEVIAVACALRDARRCSCLQVSITGSDNARFSPGVLLFMHIAEACCAQGLDWLDLGVGEASYKNWFCDEAEPLFDSCLPVTAAGRLMAAGQRGAGVLKRHIKRSPRLWNLVLATRRRLFAAPLTPP
ncbi:hypothetical protein BLTE_20180 [Blastochloris tepida]|uniref:BioF2-like acetyltransferase domain-containing protein n=1 Tax=Blastochloris tepida TaxID=2233851 RepID=A0A348G1A0_9HYPH|nr:hypothetical protein BLTE_20180 [Blastochloris tepida]